MNEKTSDAKVPSPDLQALLTLSYGVCIVTSRRGEKFNGMISNTVVQVANTPQRLAAAINKNSLTHDFISDSGVFAATVLAESAPMKLIGLFGFKSGRDTDKFSQVTHETGTTGCPVVRDHALACIDVRVETRLDCGTHTLFVGEVVDARILASGKPMTYAYYREVLQGKTPPAAPGYRAAKTAKPQPEKKVNTEIGKYVCNVCGYVYDPEKGDPENDVAPGTSFQDIPDTWVCPVCGVGKDDFSPVTAPDEATG